MDIAVIGAGPGGLTAAIYAARYGRSVTVFESAFAGGQMVKTVNIENYPGFDEKTDGYTLAGKMKNQALQNGVVFKNEPVKKIDFENKIIFTENGQESAKAVILAMGASPRKLGVKGETEFSGKGVSYCAACDGMFFKGKTAVVAGGGDTALEDALFLKNICKKVYIIHRRNKLRAVKSLCGKAEKSENIEIVYSANIKEICGGDRVEYIKTENGTIETDAVFIAVGNEPQSGICPPEMKNENGYVVTDENMRTCVDGIFCCGDLREKTLRQIVTACADGAVAAYEAVKYIEK